jgi:serine O-acetyltransferase
MLLTIYRASRFFCENGFLGVSGFFKKLNVFLFGADISPRSNLGKAISMPHPNGIVIGEGVVVEDGCQILSGVVLGTRYPGIRPGKGDMPFIRRNCIIGAGAKILGPVVIGEGAVVGANSVVLSDVPAGVTVIGVPAKPMGIPKTKI